MSANAKKIYTVDEVLAFPDDGNRYELVYGKLLVSPSPSFRHQLVASRLYRAVAEYCERHHVGLAMYSPADLTWGRKDVIAQPDVFVIGPNQGDVTKWADVRTVPLIAEVLSPSTKQHDRVEKRGLYRDRRVDVYWIVDPGEDLVEVWTPESQFPLIAQERLEWHPAGAPSPLIIALSALFA